MIFGLDHLGGAKYADLAVQEHPSGWAFGVFWNVDGFGSAEELIKKVAKTGRAPIIRVQGIWRDDHNTTPFSEADKVRAVKIAQRLEAIAKQNGNVEFRYSPFTEHKNSPEFMRDAFRLIKKAAPSLVLVNNPNHDCRTIIDEVINEFHGKEKKPRKCKQHQFSFDGTPCEDSDVESYKAVYKETQIFFLWSPRFNGRWEDNDTTPRPQRGGWPDPNHIDSIIYVASHRGQCSLKANHLYKSHSENKGNGDPRAEKPVYICPVRARAVELVARNGQVVDTLRYYGTFSDGRFRYYSQNWGYQIAEKCKRIQGDPLTQVRINGKLFGTINAGFRFGGFR